MVGFVIGKNLEYHQIYCSDKTSLICKTEFLNDKKSDYSET